MATLTVQTISLTGIVPSYTACAVGGDTFVNNEKTFLHVKNGSGSSITVTVSTPATTSGLAIADVAVAVGAGAEKMIGPFIPIALFNDSTGKASITYSDVTSLTIAALYF